MSVSGPSARLQSPRDHGEPDVYKVLRGPRGGVTQGSLLAAVLSCGGRERQSRSNRASPGGAPSGGATIQSPAAVRAEGLAGLRGRSGEPPATVRHRESGDHQSHHADHRAAGAEAYRRHRFPPVDRGLYGVGNDSRVYVLDTLTGAATPVGSAPFTPEIDFFEVHFGVGFDPQERLRLIVAESGANYSISADDGTAVVQTSVSSGTVTRTLPRPRGSPASASCRRRSVPRRR